MKTKKPCLPLLLSVSVLVIDTICITGAAVSGFHVKMCVTVPLFTAERRAATGALRYLDFATFVATHY